MWLRRRIAAAERGRDQLDRKLRILLPDLQRLRIQADRRWQDWVAACEDARTWLLRAVLLGGQDALRHASPPDLAAVELIFTTTMGLRYPADVRLTTASEPASIALGNAAVEPAAAAFGAALLAGVRLAAAEEAVRRAEAEVTTVRRRLRALEKRWLASLGAELATLELSLEQAEQEDGVRLRRAADAPSDRRNPP
jgi:V/A-type H+-transporting ATPase subunit D